MRATSEYIDKSIVRSLAQRSNFMGTWLTFHVWASIIIAGAVFVAWPNPVTFVFSVTVIGSRQLGMAILMHDAAHGVLFRSKKINDFVGHYILALPYGANMHEYRRYHLVHHKYAQRPNDPDIGLSEKFPVTHASMLRKFVRDLTGQTGFKLRLSQLANQNIRPEKLRGEDNVFGPSTPWPYIGLNVLMFACLAALGVWWAYFILWALPLLTWFQFVLRVRNIAEHAMTTHDDNPLTHARTTRTNILTRIFLAPYWVNYHIEHHAFMYVPCYNLPKLHRALIGAGLGHQMDIKPGYFAVLKQASSA